MALQGKFGGGVSVTELTTTSTANFFRTHDPDPVDDNQIHHLHHRPVSPPGAPTQMGSPIPSGLQPGGDTLEET